MSFKFSEFSSEVIDKNSDSAFRMEGFFFPAERWLFLPNPSNLTVLVVLFSNYFHILTKVS
jgi:hypothetical protein